MINKQIFVEYRREGVLANPFSVTLESRDATYGIKNKDSGEVFVAAGTATTNDSTGVYSYTGSFDEETVYTVSWKIIPYENDPANYVLQQVGPFQSGSSIRACSNSRGTFRQGTSGILFLRVSDLDGNAVDPESIGIQILDADNNIIISTFPEKAGSGFYVYDWAIEFDRSPGAYLVKWSYTVDDEDKIELQDVNVAESNDDGSHTYSPRIQEMRMSLTYMLNFSQMIPVYREPAKKSKDHKTFSFTHPRWNQSAGVRIFVNNEIATSGFEVDYFNGTVTFENPLTKYDQVDATYNFRWFSDEELDRFLSNGIHLLNIWPPTNPTYSLNNVIDRWIPIVLYGAAVDALRNMMLALQFQQPQLVFGGPDAAQKVFSNLEGLKKNYEETWNKALEQKKYGPYKGLTRTVTTPEFALPGGRSRWFRYMFSSG